MPIYFYLIHVQKPQQIALQIPLYVEASNLDDARQKCEILKARFTRGFDLIFEPSEPKMLVDSNNGRSLGTFFTALGNGQSVELEFIPSINFNLDSAKFSE
jgi:hypothetical protein